MQYLIPLGVSLGFIALLIGAFLARHVLYVVPEGEQHVVQRFGRFRTIRRPGVRLRLPLLEQVSRLSELPFALPFDAIVTTRDGATFVARGAIELKIADGRRYLRNRRSIVRTGPALVRGQVGDAIARRTSAELDRGAIAAEVTAALRPLLHRYGLEVVSVVLSGLRRRPDGVVRLSVAAA